MLAEREQRILELTAPKVRKPPLTISFEHMDFGARAGSPIIVIRLKILNSGPVVTIHDIRLCSDTDPKISYTPSNNGFSDRLRSRNTIRVESGDALSNYLEFMGDAKKQKWVLEYSDAHDEKWKEPIPPELCR